MLSKEDLFTWSHKHKVSQETMALIERIRTSQPSRAVKSGRSNVIGKYPSRKMGFTIQFESHRVELPFVIELEKNADVLEFYDQPPQIKLKYQSLSGRNMTVSHTPDFFVIRSEGAGWVECKSEADLLQLKETSPQRYVLDKNGIWRCPPGEEYAVKWGLTYTVFSSKAINPVYQRNLTLLEDYWKTELKIDTKTFMSAVTLVSAYPGITLLDAINKLQTVSVDDWYALIVSGDVFVDLHDYPLVEAEKVRLYAGKYAAELKSVDTSLPSFTKNRPIQPEYGLAIDWDGKSYTVLNVGMSGISLQSEDGSVVPLKNSVFEDLVKHGQIKATDLVSKSALPQEVQDILMRASVSQIKEANRRAAMIEEYLAIQRKPKNVPERTFRTWRKKYREAKEKWGSGYIGLIPKKTGNSTPRLPPEVCDALSNSSETLFRCSVILICCGHDCSHFLQFTQSLALP